MTRYTVADHGHGQAILQRILRQRMVYRQEVTNRSAVRFFRYRDKVQSSIPGLLFDLFHGGKVSLGGRELRLENPGLPVAVLESDHIRWVFPAPVKVSTPGPDSSVREIKQYRDKIVAEVWPWATIEIEVTE
jgi:hypothetical protein